MSVLEVNDLRCHYYTDSGIVKAIDGISLELERGEIVGVIGESGSGKTTFALSTMRLLGGQASVSGTISYNGTDITRLPEPEMDRLRWKDIAIVFQNSLEVLNPVMTVGRQVIEPLLKHTEMEKRDAEVRCRDLFASVGLDPVWVDAYPHQLSGGMRQRVLIAMALSCDPRVLILDEVTSALDTVTRKEIQDLLADLQRKKGYGMILISHDLSFVSSLASRMIVLYAGRVVESGPTADIINTPRHPYTRGLVHSTPDIFIYKDLWGIPGEPPSEGGHAGCPFYRRCTQATPICSTTPPDLMPCGDGREIACHRGGVVSLLRADGLRYRYRLPDGRSLHAIDDVSLEVSEGEVLAIVGQTGSGKSTLAHILAGILRPEAGEVRFMDGAVYGGDAGHRFGGIQIVFQDPFSSTSNRFTVLDAIREPLEINGIGSRSERFDMVREALKMVMLPRTDQFLGKYCGELSGGQRQRIALARAMTMRPKLLIADEITSALDVSTAANVLRLLKRLQNRRGFAMIYVSHDLSLTLKIADRIAVMDAGKIVEVGNAHEVILNPRDARTKRLVGARIGYCCHLHGSGWVRPATGVTRDLRGEQKG